MSDLSSLINKLNIAQNKLNNPNCIYNINHINQIIIEISQKINNLNNLITSTVQNPIKKRKI